MISQEDALIPPNPYGAEKGCSQGSVDTVRDLRYIVHKGYLNKRHMRLNSVRKVNSTDRILLKRSWHLVSMGQFLCRIETGYPR